MNDLIKVLEGKRWFIWALVSVIAGLGSLAIYINYVNQTDNLVLSTETVVHKTKTNAPISTTLSNQYWDGSNLYMHIGAKDAQWVAGCSGGTITGPFKLDSTGSFSLMGTY